MTEKGEPTLAERIEAVEQAYEFMLAYAAQGARTRGVRSVSFSSVRLAPSTGSRGGDCQPTAAGYGIK